jgi:hypothetical protein
MQQGSRPVDDKFPANLTYTFISMSITCADSFYRKIRVCCLIFSSGRKDMQLTSEQKYAILDASLAAAERGDPDDQGRLIRQIPLAPRLAKAAKEIWGKAFLLQEGYDLSAAEAAYGPNWLD